MYLASKCIYKENHIPGIHRMDSGKDFDNSVQQRDQLLTGKKMRADNTLSTVPYYLAIRILLST